jgi:hypothetical protein
VAEPGDFGFRGTGIGVCPTRRLNYEAALHEVHVNSPGRWVLGTTIVLNGGDAAEEFLWEPAVQHYRTYLAQCVGFRVTQAHNNFAWLLLGELDVSQALRMRSDQSHCNQL